MVSLNILCSDPPYFLKDVTEKIRKEAHKKIFCGPTEVFKNISWPINICLKYFTAFAKSLCCQPPKIHLRHLAGIQLCILVTMHWPISEKHFTIIGKTYHEIFFQ